jgi:sigma-E factor negative regulatory protein RseC
MAQVEVEQGGCGRCHEEGGCGGQQLTQMFCSGSKTYRVTNAVGAEIGDRVRVGIAPGSVSKTANLAYILPLTVAFAGAALGTSLGGDAGGILGAICGLITTFAYIRFRVRPEAGNPAESPYIISVLD